MKHTVGVVMAAYNGERFIEEQLRSILDQTHRPDRIVITDDASTDGTPEILERYARRHPAILLHRNERNIGYVKNFEQGISLCDTDVIALSDQDDIWGTGKLGACVEALSAAPGGTVVASIPNVRHKPILRDLILRDEFRYRDAGNLDISHIRFFTRRSMRRLFEETGYEVLRLEPVSPISDPFKRLVIFLTGGFWESFYAHQYAVVARVRS